MILRSALRFRWWIPALYLGTSLVFFLPALLTQRIPLPLENVYSFPDSLWAAHRPSAVQGVSNFTLGDVPNYYYPYMDAAVPRLQKGEIPLWNPYIYSGMPFMAAHQPAVLYPLNLLFAPIGAKWIWVPTAMIRLLLMGWGLHLFMRWLGVRDSAALWSGISYQFCASGIAWLHFGIHNVLAFLPLALYATERLIATPRGRWFLLLTICLSVQFLGGHPETSTLFGGLWASWAAIRIPWRRPGRALILLGFAVLTAVGLALPQLLPTVALVRASGTLARRPNIAPVGSWSNIRYWLLLINPYLSGTPVGNRYWSRTGNYNEYAIYMGFLTTPLAIIGMIRGRPRAIILFWTVVALLSLGLRFPLPGLNRIYTLRLLQVGSGIRFNFSWSLAAAILAGLGVEAVMQQARRSRALVLILTTGCVALLLCSVYTLSHAGQISWVLGGNPRHADLTRVAEFYQRHNMQLVILVSLAIVGWILMTCLFARQARMIVLPLLLLITLIDLLANGMFYNGYIYPQAIYPPTPVTAALAGMGGHFRIEMVDGHIMPGNASMTQHLDNVLGSDDLVSLRYMQFASRSNSVDRVGRIDVIRPLAQRFFDLANVEFVFNTRTLSSTPDVGWKLWRKDGDVRVYRNPQVLPRAYAVSDVRVVRPEQAIDAVYAPRFDPRYAAVVEERIPQLVSSDVTGVQAYDNREGLSRTPQASQRTGSTLHATTQIASYAPEQVALDVGLSQPALVVLSDSYAPGWRVTVDGTPAHLYRTNAVFRGVVVGAGHHRIVFRYQPQDVRWGTVGAGLTIGLCLIGCWWTRRRRRIQNYEATTYYLIGV